MYTEEVDPSVAAANGLNSNLDGMKMRVKLAEHTTQVTVRGGCDGPGEDGTCPPWSTVAESRPRQATVSGIRKVMQFLRNN